MRVSFGVLAGAAFALSALPAAAHHGWGGNVDQVTEMTGVVVSPVSLSGPHGTMKIKTADGKTWDITLAPPFRTSAAGLKQDTIPVGAMLLVRIPFRPEVEVVCRAEVIYSDPGRGLGLRFVDLSAEGRAMLEHEIGNG